MSKQPDPSTLLDDLEAIRKSLEKESGNDITIPTLEEIVGHRSPVSVNTENPFLSSSSLSELIRIRNEAENRAAQELASLRKISEAKTEAPKKVDPEAAEQYPDPGEIMTLMETRFDQWIESSVQQYMQLFESELRNRLQQDFRALIVQWYRNHQLPIPEAFVRPAPKKD